MIDGTVAKQLSFSEGILKLPTLICTKQYMNNTKLSRILTTKGIDITEDSFDLKINERVVNLVDICSDENITLSNNNISQYDLAVMDAVYTIISQGSMIITPEWILRVMSGNSKQKPTESKIKQIKESIKKLQSVRIKVDCTEEYNAYRLQKGQKPVDSWTYESYLLPLGKVEARYEANGKAVTAYTVLEKPALYKYAEMNHQIIDFPAGLLETEEYFNDTEEAVLIKRYVIRRVAQIVKKKNKLKGNKISFLWYDKEEKTERGLFPELGYKPDGTKVWRNKKSKINEIVKGTLQTLVNHNAITKFEEYREDGTNNPASPIIGYKIFYNEKETVLPVN